MSENLVRDIHDAAATSSIPAEASVRPPGTTHRGARRHAPRRPSQACARAGMSVLEIGCGVALSASPSPGARRGMWSGLRAPRGGRCESPVPRGGLADKATAVSVDVLALGDIELREPRSVRPCARVRGAALRSLRAGDGALPAGHSRSPGERRAGVDRQPRRSRICGPTGLRRRQRTTATRSTTDAVARWTLSAGKVARPADPPVEGTLRVAVGHQAPFAATPSSCRRSCRRTTRCR